jgi:type I restriction-modification system DNA methylase subunit
VDASDFKTHIFPLLFFKRISDVYDEERGKTEADLESHLWGAEILLRGYIDAGDYRQFIFPLLFWKRLCDIDDEETRRAGDQKQRC